MSPSSALRRLWLAVSTTADTAFHPTGSLSGRCLLKIEPLEGRCLPSFTLTDLGTLGGVTRR